MTVDGPLRILAVISSPINLEELDVDAEERRLREALAPRVESGLVVIDRLPSATLGDLGDWLRRHSTHVIHFVGHGDFDARLREGVVYFQDEHGKVSMQRVAVLFCFAVMAAIVLMFATRLPASAITGDFFIWVFGIFGGLWSMSAVAVKLVEALHAKWTK